MTEIFAHKDYTVVGFYKTILEEAGIVCMVRNEISQNLVVDLPATARYPALCVANDEDAERAVAILREYKFAEAAQGQEWKCPACGEEVPAEFASCWKCESLKPGVTVGDDT